MRSPTLMPGLLLLCLSAATAQAADDVGCPNPNDFVDCPKMGVVFPRVPSDVIYVAPCSGRPKGFKRSGPNVPRDRGVHLQNTRCGIASSDDPNLNDRPCGYYQRGSSCNEGEK